jgi:DNA-binding transcriptional MerR regulator
MPKLTSLRGAGPFKADELVGKVDELIADLETQSFQKRTLRYYISQGIIPRPMGSPKKARYGYEHLLSAVAAKMLQDRGMLLEQVKLEVGEVHNGRFDRMERMVEEWLTAGRPRPAMAVVAETRATYAEGPRSEPLPSWVKPVRSVMLGDSARLEVREDMPLREALQKAQRSIQGLLENWDKKAGD